MSNIRFKIGDRVKVQYNPDWSGGYMQELEGHEGIVVVEFHDYDEVYIQYGVDFGKRILGCNLNDLDGDITTLTGRYFYAQELVLVHSPELQIIEDPQFSNMYV